MRRQFGIRPRRTGCLPLQINAEVVTYTAAPDIKRHPGFGSQHLIETVARAYGHSCLRAVTAQGGREVDLADTVRLKQTAQCGLGGQTALHFPIQIIETLRQLANPFCITVDLGQFFMARHTLLQSLDGLLVLPHLVCLALGVLFELLQTLRLTSQIFGLTLEFLIDLAQICAVLGYLILCLLILLFRLLERGFVGTDVFGLLLELIVDLLIRLTQSQKGFLLVSG